jgi:hypothetical protein
VCHIEFCTHFCKINVVLSFGGILLHKVMCQQPTVGSTSPSLFAPLDIHINHPQTKPLEIMQYIFFLPFHPTTTQDTGSS